MSLKQIFFKIIYDGVDITNDISDEIESIEYVDRIQGASDEITISIDDTNNRWKNDWKPDKESQLQVSLGYLDASFDAGTFDIDKLEIDGPPDIITIQGLAAGIKKAIRTKQSEAFENQTLEKIVERISSKNGFNILGNIESIQIERATQNQETDLEFLKRISNKFGHVFSVRNQTIFFNTIYELEDANSVYSLDKSQISKYKFTDESINTYSSAQVRFTNPDKKKVIEFVSVDEDLVERKDIKEVKVRAENAQQAEKISKAALHESNSMGVIGHITCEGNQNLLAGLNIDLTGFGKYSGKYNILESRHSYRKDDGYSTIVKVKKIDDIGEEFHTSIL